jgi:hypothetical protein
MALLAGLLLGGIKVVKRRAKKAHARSEVEQIVTAWNAYYADYKRFPAPGKESSFDLSQMGDDAIHILHGNYDLAEYPNHAKYKAQNPRGTAYLEFHEAYTGGFKDPWGHIYQLALDQYKYDGEVEYDGIKLKYSVVAWSMGPDGQSGTPDDVHSWDKR